MTGMRMSDDDPKYQNLKHLRDDLGYKGPIDQAGKPKDINGNEFDPKTGKKVK